MSSYATPADFEAYGLPRDAWGERSDDEIQAKLDSACSTADSYLDSPTSKFTLPLIAPFPESLKDAVCRITAYNLPSVQGYNPEGQSENLRLRYEDAIRWLEGIAAGRITPVGVTDSSSTGNGASGVPYVVSPQYDCGGNFVADTPKPRGWR